MDRTAASLMFPEAVEAEEAPVATAQMQPPAMNRAQRRRAAAYQRTAEWKRLFKNAEKIARRKIALGDYSPVEE